MPMINIEDTYILDETGAEVDKVTGLFTKNENATTGEKQMARLNIAAGGSNPNLLDNAYFVGGGSQLGDGVFPINQRGLSNYGAGYTIDRWKLSSGGTLVFTNDGISINGLFFQKKVIDFTVGETYTLSRQTTDGNVVSVTGVVPSNEGWMIGDQNFGVYFRPSTKVCDIQIWGTYLLKAVKLEKGTVSTLANDPVPDFGEELRKCQRYLFIRDYAQNDIIANGLTNNLTIFLPVSMRSGGSPTMTFTATPYVIGNGVISTPTSVGLVSVNGNQVQIYAPTTESHNAQTIVLYAGSATRMTISNEP